MNALLLAQGFGFIGALVPRLTDLFVSGNVVGVDALAAIAAIMPVTVGVLFVGKLVYCGSGYLFARYQGEFRRDRAREVVGMSLELAALALYCWFRDGNAIPEPMFEKGNAILNVSFRPAPERIVEMRNEVEAFLSAHGVSRETVGRIALLAEECSMALVDRHGGRAKRIVAETSITVGKGNVQVVFRDTGDRSDLTDGDAHVSSLRTFVIAGLMRVVRVRQHLNTLGCNRAMFKFKVSL